MQEPMILGLLNGVPTAPSTGTVGYGDPNSTDAPETQEERYRTAPDFGPYPILTNISDLSRFVVNDSESLHPLMDFKRSRVDDLTGEPETPFAAQYPYNHVRETESGHVKEYDDTPGFERIHEYHRSGTFYEVHPDGTRVTKIVGDNYEITHHNKQVRVRGDVKVFVDGDSHLYVRGNMFGQVDQNLKFNVGKNIDIHAGENIRMFANKSIELTSQTTSSFTSVGNMQFQTSANLYTKVEADSFHETHGSNYTSITGDYTVSGRSSANFIFNGAYTTEVGSYMEITANSFIDIVGSTIDLNKAGRSMTELEDLEDFIYLDTGDIVSGITAWDYLNPDEQGNATTIDAPKSAEVLAAKAFVSLADQDSFHGNDDVELTEDEIRSGIESGTVRPTTFERYSLDSSGTYNTEGAAAVVLATPAEPTEEGSIVEPEAGNTSLGVDAFTGTPAANYDENGRWVGGINYNYQISNHYQLKDLSITAVVSKYRIIHNQHGLTEQQTIDNISLLARGALDLIKDQYPNMIVTSCYRQGSGTSQHERGQAADMQFTGIQKSEYLGIAQWIRENIPHDQLLLEFKNTGTGMPWIHLSLKDFGNRTQIMTFFNHRRYGEVGRFYQLA
jgi:hypothetical protein